MKDTKSSPKISVVIPLYNKEAYISRCLDSVLTQSYPATEILIVDDGSTDNSARVVESFMDTRIRLHKKNNGGPASARNFGIIQAKEDIIAFIDADDQWLPDFLKEIATLASHFNQAEVFGTAVYNNNGERSVVKYTDRLYRKGWRGIVDPYKLIFRGFPFNSSSVAIKKEALIRLNGFNEKLRYGEDVDLWTRLCLQVPIAYSHNYLSEVFQNANNRSDYETAHFDFYSHVIAAIEKQIKNTPDLDNKLINKYKSIITGIDNLKKFFIYINISHKKPRSTRWLEFVESMINDEFTLSVLLSPAIPVRQRIKMVLVFFLWFVYYITKTK